MAACTTIVILWTAMSLALGVEIQGEIIRGLPCIKRLNQLFCPTAGNRYPGDPIERFIDENKALIRRMYGEFQTSGPAESPSRRRKRADSEFFMDSLDIEDNIFGERWAAQSANKTKRQTDSLPNDQKDDPNKSDSCESTVEVVTPYWAANSAGKVRAIVNTQHFEQAVHQEVCSSRTTKRCTGDCSCEQKYKWHRLLAYDPDNDCKGIFMDWFLFPSCCVCRCLPFP